MRPCYLIVQSKNKQSIKKFSLFLKEILIVKFKTIIQLFQKKRCKKVLTILKSPHVNKNAQEQFESRIYSRKYFLYSPFQYKCLLFLKKNQKKLFPDISIKTLWKGDLKLLTSFQSNLFNPNNYRITNTSSKSQHLNLSELKRLRLESLKFGGLKRVARFIKILDIYGELNLKNQKFKFG